MLSNPDAIGSALKPCQAHPPFSPFVEAVKDVIGLLLTTDHFFRTRLSDIVISSTLSAIAGGLAEE